MTARPAGSLLALAGALRSGAAPLLDYLEALRVHFAAREPSVLAFVPEADRFGRLQREARALLARYPDPAARPPLFGVPIGVKDIFHVQGFVTRAGSRLPSDQLQGPEAESVTRLRQAGALVLGKTVTTEFAYFGPGPTRNPHQPGHTPGGSSSGSAAAVAAGLCPLALGTQTIGSIVRPAAFCGVVGYKPSYDRISRAGVIPLSPSLDHVGLFAEDVAGIALAAGSLCQAWRPSAAEPAPSTVEAGRPVLGVPAGPYLEHASEAGRTHFEAALGQLRTAGYSVKPVPAMPDFEHIYERHYVITDAEAARVHAAWFPRYRDLYHPKTVAKLEHGLIVTDSELAEALRGRETLRRELTGLMDEHGLDLWIAPSAVGAAPAGLDSTGDPVMNLPWSQAGLPAVGLPASRNAEGLPLGVQLVGRWYADEQLLGWAADVQLLLSPGGGGGT